MARTILALIPDLMVATRVQEAAKRLGLDIELAESQEDLLHRPEPGKPAAIVVDLSAAGLDLAAIVTGAHERGVRVLAYGPHVDAPRLRAAREAGIDRV